MIYKAPKSQKESGRIVSKTGLNMHTNALCL